MRTEVTTQAAFDAAAKAGKRITVRAGFFVARGNSSVVARGNSSVVAWGNSSVVAWGNSSVEAWGNSSVVARGNSSVVAWGNSSVEARGNSSVVAWGNVFVRLFSALKITASIHVAIMIHGRAQEIEGGQHLQAAVVDTPAAWCEHHGVTVRDEVAVVYKCVHDDYESPHGTSYAPGTTPEAEDWDDGAAECGGGLHFSPRPFMARSFCNGNKYIACPVALADMRAPHDGDQFPEKIKARRVIAPCYEVDRHGNPVEA